MKKVLAAVLKKNQVAQVFPPFSEAPRLGCLRAKARWFSGYPKTQLADDKTRGVVGGVLSADRTFPLADALAAVCGNAGGDEC